MSVRCPELPELLELAGRPAEGDVRRHLDTCPRCRNRLAMFADFIAPPDLPAEAELAEAERRLGATLAGLRRETAASAGGGVPAAGAGAAGDGPRRDEAPFGGVTSRRRPMPRRSWFSPETWTPWRLALAGGGALAAIAVVATLVARRPEPPGMSTLREEAPASSVTLRAPATLPDGRIRLEWSPDPEAEAYRVRVLGPDLTELMSRDVTGTTSIEVERRALPAELASGTVLGWTVAVMRGGGEIRRSATATVRVP